MCGEHSEDATKAYEQAGSSPHVRGAHKDGVIHNAELGIIPACAGSTVRTEHKHLGTGDHPRMCGEHPPKPRILLRTQGSSPHVRGARWRASHLDYRQGIIPACAGSTSVHRRVHCCDRDHPRMCGEHVGYHFSPAVSLGSSPHVRGARLHRR